MENIITSMLKKTLVSNLATETVEQSKKTLTRALIDCQDRDGYAALLLDEYKALVEVLSDLDDRAFSTLQLEINEAVDQLVTWFSNISTNNTLNIYHTICELKQKALRGKAKDKTPPIAYGKMLLSCEFV
jgi:hypothetical protein